jgi:hypothetical protein
MERRSAARNYVPGRQWHRGPPSLPSKGSGEHDRPNQLQQLRHTILQSYIVPTGLPILVESSPSDSSSCFLPAPQSSQSPSPSNRHPSPSLTMVQQPSFRAPSRQNQTCQPHANRHCLSPAANHKMRAANCLHSCSPSKLPVRIGWYHDGTLIGC